jgi:recombinational DNA repair protein RecR
MHEEREEDEAHRRERFEVMTELLSHLAEIVLTVEGVAKLLKHLAQYAMSQMLINLDATLDREASLVKALAVLGNPVAMREMDLNEAQVSLLRKGLRHVLT